MPSRQNRRPLALVSIVPPALLLALVAGCREGSADRSVTAQAAALEASFPGRSAAVIRNGLGFTATARGFTAAGVDQAPVVAAHGRTSRGRRARRGRAAIEGAPGPTLSLEVPADATQALHFRAGGASIAVREIDARGEAHAVEQAVGYPRVGGTSFWTALPCGKGRAAQTACGAEEWLRFEPGVITDGAAAATWEITGATLVDRGAAIEVTSDDGATRLWVTAPAAYAEGGAPVEARLQVAGAAIQLFVEAGGRGVLVDPIWLQVAHMPGALEYHASATTGDGRVLVAGGDDGQPGTLDVAYLYDPKNDAWTTEPPMTNPREDHTFTTLKSGQVLVAGGDDQGQPLGDADVFDPATETWTNSQMPTQHSGHTATLLENGTVLIAGGFGSGSCGGTITLNNVDLFDPTLGLGNMWSPATPLNDARDYHTATRLQNGKVLVVGGYGEEGPLSDCEIYDPVQQTWTFTEGSLGTAREDHTAALLPDGTVLVVGGDGDLSAYASAEIYDPVKDTWSLTGSLTTARSLHSMVTLPDGRLLVVGGDDGTQTLASTEIYDPGLGTWSAGPTLTQPRELFALSTYGNTVIATGGWNDATEQATPTAEIVLFGQPNGAACLTAGACNSGFCTAGLCCDTDCTGTCTACTAKLKGTGKDGTCGPVEKGTNPGSVCQDDGAASCGGNGFCNGAGACGTYVDGTVCSGQVECVVAVCTGGVCGGPHELDGSPCKGGVCIAGTCVKDPIIGTGATSGSGGEPTTSSSTGGGNGAGGAGAGAGGSGEGGDAAHGNLSGGACRVGAGGPQVPASAGGVMASLALGFLAALRRRRERWVR